MFFLIYRCLPLPKLAPPLTSRLSLAVSPPHRALLTVPSRILLEFSVARVIMIRKSLVSLGAKEPLSSSVLSLRGQDPGKPMGIKSNQNLRLSVSCLSGSKNEIRGPLRVSFLKRLFIFNHGIGYLREEKKVCS